MVHGVKSSREVYVHGVNILAREGSVFNSSHKGLDLPTCVSPPAETFLACAEDLVLFSILSEGGGENGAVEFVDGVSKPNWTVISDAKGGAFFIKKNSVGVFPSIWCVVGSIAHREKGEDGVVDAFRQALQELIGDIVRAGSFIGAKAADSIVVDTAVVHIAEEGDGVPDSASGAIKGEVIGT
jgi:hypothetical protein